MKKQPEADHKPLLYFGRRIIGRRRANEVIHEIAYGLMVPAILSWLDDIMGECHRLAGYAVSVRSGKVMRWDPIRDVFVDDHRLTAEQEASIIVIDSMIRAGDLRGPDQIIAAARAEGLLHGI